MLDIQLIRQRIVIDFDYYEGKNAILFSGGVESTLLAYIFHNHPNVELFLLDRINNPIPKVKILGQKMKELLDKELHYTLLPISEGPNHLDNGKARKILEQNHNYIISGWNQYPEDTNIRPKILYKPKYNGKVKYPLAHLQKHQTILAYYELGIDCLLPYTHSCGYAEVQPCGICFNCRERIWAYKKLNMKPDLGI